MPAGRIGTPVTAEQVAQAKALALVWRRVVWEEGEPLARDLRILTVARELGVADLMADELSKAPHEATGDRHAFVTVTYKGRVEPGCGHVTMISSHEGRKCNASTVDSVHL